MNNLPDCLTNEDVRDSSKEFVQTVQDVLKMFKDCSDVKLEGLDEDLNILKSKLETFKTMTPEIYKRLNGAMKQIASRYVDREFQEDNLD